MPYVIVETDDNGEKALLSIKSELSNGRTIQMLICAPNQEACVPILQSLIGDNLDPEEDTPEALLDVDYLLANHGYQLVAVEESTHRIVSDSKLAILLNALKLDVPDQHISDMSLVEFYGYINANVGTKNEQDDDNVSEDVS